MPQLLAGIRVLVVEDHSDSRDMVEEALVFLGAQVITAATAEAGVRRLGEADVVITDYSLPGHDGVWLLERIKDAGLTIPTVLVSGFAAVHVPEVAAAHCSLKFLKPIDPLELGRQVGLLLGRQ